MVVQFHVSRIRDDRTGGTIIIKDPQTNSDYARWTFHVDGEDSNMPGENVWKWENPNEDKSNLTLSPSLKYEGGIGPHFHIFIRDGEIEHCGDCECGCE